ncbi:hypothetical protein VPNG_04143 [Cytospora leucostoma]|uniref:Transmembrane protein n=1 Tax=Cytospora leucostoma TaxID=1230097 RepID=A0A423XDG5_9PEZI|nr:hypothetical protein VPNG_04143 [Cytospora leucostoma]
MRVQSSFSTAVLALLLAQPIVALNGGIRAEENAVSITTGNGENDVEPRRLHGRSRWQVHREVVEVRVPKPANGDDDSGSGDAKTTLSTSTTTSSSLAATTSPNTWVAVQHVTGTAYTTVTCMTPKTVATSACSYINDKETTCVSTSAVVPTCLPGMLCSFSGTTGAVSCMRKSGIDASGFVVVGVFGLGVAVAVVTICSMCCRERRQTRAARRAAEAKLEMLAAKELKKTSMVEVAGAGGAGGAYAPLVNAADAHGPSGAAPVHPQEQRYGD